jgi:S1-C subfamily serine protease
MRGVIPQLRDASFPALADCAHECWSRGGPCRLPTAIRDWELLADFRAGEWADQEDGVKLIDLYQAAGPAVCSINFLAPDQKLIASGTGFVVGSYLITNNHVIQIPPHAASVVLHFANQSLSLPLSIATFREALIDGDPEEGWDYAILKPAGVYFERIKSLHLAHHDALSPGSSIAFLGYHFGQQQLAMHSGIVSARFKSAGVDKYQLDASVNPSNSGGPLLNPETGDVIGIITRKATGLSDQFDALLRSFDQLGDAYQQSMASGMQGIIAGIDPVRAGYAVQQQMKQVALELKRSANVGIGFAYEIWKVRTIIERLK